MSVLAIALSAAIAWLATAALAVGRGVVILDHPNERSLHSQPTPRTGGLAIVAAVLAGHLGLVLAGRLPVMPSLWAGAALVFSVSVADDVRHMPAGVRMLVHLVAASLLLVPGPGLEHIALPGVSLSLSGPVAGVVTILFVAWVTNLYNFMDGMDGLAGGMGVLGFGCYGLLAWRADAAPMAISCLVIAAACAGFLAHNFPPARIFMGDAGSSVLGFLAGAFAVHADAAGYFPLWISVLVFSPFIVDASVTLVRRLLRGERVWRAHRSHFYQRLVAAGWSHRRTTLCEYALMVTCAAAALLAAGAPAGWQAPVLWVIVLVYAMLIVCVRRFERHRDIP